MLSENTFSKQDAQSDSFLATLLILEIINTSPLPPPTHTPIIYTEEELMSHSIWGLYSSLKKI